MAASATTGIYLLHIVVASPVSPQALDLISRIEAAKDKGQDPA
jgi:hypothetical protein